MKRYNVAIVGATGMVGQTIIQVLQERNFPIAGLKLLASSRSAGREIEVIGRTYKVEEARPEAFAGVDVAFFSAGGSVSEKLVPEAVKRGTVVIDNSSAFRMAEDVPLVVPEVNPKPCGTQGTYCQPQLFHHSNGGSTASLQQAAD